jgi:hypothetical protein
MIKLRNIKNSIRKRAKQMKKKNIKAYRSLKFQELILSGYINDMHLKKWNMRWEIYSTKGWQCEAL